MLLKELSVCFFSQNLSCVAWLISSFSKMIPGWLREHGFWWLSVLCWVIFMRLSADCSTEQWGKYTAYYLLLSPLLFPGAPPGHVGWSWISTHPPFCVLQSLSGVLPFPACMNFTSSCSENCVFCTNPVKLEGTEHVYQIVLCP